MAKYKKKQTASPETIDAAMTISKGIQKPNQTREQTKLIAQGIQKGIAEYKKQQKNKARVQDKLKRKITHQQASHDINSEAVTDTVAECKIPWLPWTLLIVSWMAMAVYIIWQKNLL